MRRHSTKWYDPICRCWRTGAVNLNKVRTQIWPVVEEKCLEERVENKEGGYQRLANTLAIFWQGLYKYAFPLCQSVDAWQSSDTFMVPLREGDYQGAAEEILAKLPRAVGKDGSLVFVSSRRGRDTGEQLIQDYVLARTAIANVVLRRLACPGQWREQFRAASLLEPLIPDEVLCGEAYRDSDLFQMARWVRRRLWRPYPNEEAAVWSKVLRGVWYGRQVSSHGPTVNVCFVLAGLCKIREYLFQPKRRILPTMASRSERIEMVVESVARFLGDVLGPEVVIRSGGGTIEFLVPAEEIADLGVSWGSYVESMLAAGTGWATASVCHSFAAQLAVTDRFCEERNQAIQGFEIKKAVAAPPVEEVAPIEALCELCGSAPASKIRHNRSTDKVSLRCVGCGGRRSANGVVPSQSHEGPLRILPPAGGKTETASSVIPAHCIRPRLAVVYLDGDSFGEILAHGASLAHVIHWSRRLEATVRCAVSSSVKGDIKLLGDFANAGEGARHFRRIFVGGDEALIIAWAPVGLNFACKFAQFAEREFCDDVSSSGRPLSFSIGVALGRAKMDVRDLISVARDELVEHGAKSSALPLGVARNASKQGKCRIVLARAGPYGATPLPQANRVLGDNPLALTWEELQQLLWECHNALKDQPARQKWRIRVRIIVTDFLESLCQEPRHQGNDSGCGHPSSIPRAKYKALKKLTSVIWNELRDSERDADGQSEQLRTFVAVTSEQVNRFESEVEHPKLKVFRLIGRARLFSPIDISVVSVGNARTTHSTQAGKPGEVKVLVPGHILRGALRAQLEMLADQQKQQETALAANVAIMARRLLAAFENGLIFVDALSSVGNATEILEKKAIKLIKQKGQRWSQNASRRELRWLDSECQEFVLKMSGYVSREAAPVLVAAIRGIAYIGGRQAWGWGRCEMGGIHWYWYEKGEWRCQSLEKLTRALRRKKSSM
ncbi:MAG: hypothetical protein KatS3mg110_1764 [Pirellulaceae bacterium]|nr:MAG: hypothetical protein KatS3mg110_1764 [Pirellulaceae bacterium]